MKTDCDEQAVFHSPRRRALAKSLPAVVYIEASSAEDKDRCAVKA